MATKYISGTTIPNSTQTAAATTWHAQLAQAGTSFYLYSIKLRGYAVESSGQLVVELRTSVDNNPGALVARKKVDKNLLAAGSSDWYEVLFPSTQLTATTIYFVVVYTTSGSYVWSTRNVVADYWRTSEDSGDTWSSYNVLSEFEVWGTISPGFTFSAESSMPTKRLVAVGNNQVYIEDV